MSLFGKKTPSATPAPVAAFEAPRPPREHSIGPGMIVYGTLSFSGKLVIEGSVNGPIMGEPGSEIVVAANGCVEGSVSAGSVLIQGSVEGPVHAPSVTIENGGVVEGDIEAGTLRTADGARVNGAVRTQVSETLAQPAAKTLALPAPVETV